MLSGLSVRDLLVQLADVQDQLTAVPQSVDRRLLLYQSERAIIRELRNRRAAWQRTVAGQAPRRAADPPRARVAYLRPTGPDNPKERQIMGIGDKAKNAAQDATGKAKEAAGDATDNNDLKAEGKTDQAKASVKKAGENIKDAFND